MGGSRETSTPGSLAEGLLLAPADLSAHASSKRYCTCLCPDPDPEKSVADQAGPTPRIAVPSITGNPGNLGFVWSTSQDWKTPGANAAARHVWVALVNPPAVSSTRISDRCRLRPPCSSISVLPVQAPCSLRRTGIRHRAGGLGNAGRLSVASPDSDSSFCRASASVWRVQRYAN